MSNVQIPLQYVQHVQERPWSRISQVSPRLLHRPRPSRLASQRLSPSLTAFSDSVLLKYAWFCSSRRMAASTRQTHKGFFHNTTRNETSQTQKRSVQLNCIWFNYTPVRPQQREMYIINTRANIIPIYKCETSHPILGDPLGRDLTSSGLCWWKSLCWCHGNSCLLLHVTSSEN